jgi:uncharacterized protein (TIGR02231 family)
VPPVQTSITAVTVYPDRARVTRTGTLQLETGFSKVEISDLPLTLNPDSVRASAQGLARARLHGVQVQRVNYQDTPLEQVRQLEQEIESLQDQVEQLTVRQKLLAQNRRHLESLAEQSQVYAAAIASGETSLESQLDMFSSVRNRIEALEQQSQQLSVEIRAHQKRLGQLKSDLEHLHSPRPRQRFSILVEIEGLSAGELTLQVIYVIQGAHWTPLYDLRLREENGEPFLEAVYLGQVTQRTGEEWQEVALTLSTARPALTARPPELKPWYIAPFAPPVPTARAPQMLSVAAVPAKMEAGPDPSLRDARMDMVQAETAAAVIEESPAAVVYHIPGRVTVPLNGDPHKVTIAGLRLSPQLDYVAAPRLAESVYRRAILHNDSPYTFLPGPTSLFYGDEFLGTASLDLIPPQGELKLYLGTEDRIKIERKLTRREVDKSFVGARRRIHYTYQIEIENLLDANAALELHDQIPVSRHEDIKVKLDSISPKPVEQDGMNLIQWDLPLSPRQKRSVSFSFSVEHPKGVDVLGLP